MFLFSLVLLPFVALTQQKTKIIVEKSDNLVFKKEGDVTYLRKPVFRHDNAVLVCDSAVLYGGDKNYFEAFGNVHINQADSVHIYSDFLTYNGNSKVAHATKNVRMVHKDAVLTTNFLDYDMAPRIGKYWNNGKIVTKDITINSKTGYYFANSRDAYFRYNVKAVTEQSTITSDTLRYNTLSNWAYFYGPTNIKGKEDNLYTENGVYNTQSGDAVFGKNNLYTNGSRSLTGDSLYYYGQKAYGKAVKNIVFRDTVDKAVLKGNLGEYYRKEERVIVTKGAYVGLGTEDSILVRDVKIPDTLWISADTLISEMALVKDIPPKITESRVASKNGEPLVQSINPVSPLRESNESAIIPKAEAVIGNDSLQTDTAKTRVINAYYNVKVYKSNLQAKADSLYYADADSTIRWFKNPIIWAENSQQTGDTIYLELKNKKLYKSDIIGNAFVVNVEGDSVNFNQLKGKRIEGYFDDGNVRSIEVIGNAESIYFNREDSIVTDMHQSFAGRILFEFEDKELTGVKWMDQNQAKLTPISEVKADDKLLTNFIWKPELRPKSKEEIIKFIAPVKKASPAATPKSTTKVTQKE